MTKEQLMIENDVREISQMSHGKASILEIEGAVKAALEHYQNPPDKCKFVDGAKRAVSGYSFNLSIWERGCDNNQHDYESLLQWLNNLYQIYQKEGSNIYQKEGNNMSIERLQKLAQEIMKLGDTEKRYRAAGNLQQKIAGDLGNVMVTCKDLIEAEPDLNFGSFYSYIFQMHGADNRARMCISLVKDHYNEIVEYENDSEEKRAERQQKLKEYSQTLSIQLPPKRVIQHMGVKCYTDVVRDVSPDQVYCLHGTYRRYSEVCKSFEYRLCRAIQQSSSGDLKALFQKVCLYVALKNERTVMREVLMLRGDDVPDDDIKRPQEPDKGDVAACGVPDELDTPKAKELFQKAIKAGLMSKTDSGYKWQGTKALCAYFADRATEYLGISKARLSDGRQATNWKPFEILFAYNNLRVAKNEYRNKTGKIPKDHQTVDKLFD